MTFIERTHCREPFSTQFTPTRAPSRMKRLLCSLLLLAALVAPVRGQDNPDPTDADKAFFREFKRAALAGDRAWVIAHVCLPVRATLDGRTRMIATTEELDAAYTQLMTLDAINAINRQTPETLVRTRQGVMIGDGLVWFDTDPATAPGAESKICIIAVGHPG